MQGCQKCEGGGPCERAGETRDGRVASSGTQHFPAINGTFGAETELHRQKEGAELYLLQEAYSKKFVKPFSWNY